MNKKKLVTILILSLIIFSAIRTYDHFNPKVTTLKKSEYIMGTVVNITIDHNDSSLIESAFKKIRYIENKMSNKISNSEVSKINKNSGISPVKVSNETFYVIEKGIKYSDISSGKFDISSGPIVDLWNIGSENPLVPKKAKINEKLSLVNYRNIILDKKNKTVFLSQKNMAIDLGGIAKGYAADVLKDFLEKRDVKSGIIDIGGNLYLLGDSKENIPWNIGIKNPYNSKSSDYVGTLNISDKSIVTSGTYERFFIEDGVTYHHIFDLSNGLPAKNSLKGVSIISKKSIDADALSTTTFLLGLHNGMKLIEDLNGVEAIFITDNKKVYTTSGLKDNFKLTSKSFSIAK